MKLRLEFCHRGNNFSLPDDKDYRAPGFRPGYFFYNFNKVRLFLLVSEYVELFKLIEKKENRLKMIKIY